MSLVSISADTSSDPGPQALSPGPRAAPGSDRLWLTLAAIVALGAAAFAIAFWDEVTHAVAVWWDSTAYGHCFLVLPISVFLIWERRAALLVRLPEPSFWPVAAMAPVGLAWLFADQLGVMEGRQLIMMTLFELFLLAVLGFRAWRVIAFALLYLYFLVPTGAFLVPVMQDFAARFAVDGLQILGIPVYLDGMLIEVPGARFVIAEACAGLRFLIASVALGTLYGYWIYRSWTRRAIFMGVSVIVPLIANGFRCLGIVLLGYILNSAQAATVDHILYGWIFFSIVSLVLILLGLPFRQPMVEFPIVPPQAPTARQSPARVLAVGAAAIVLVTILTSAMVVQSPAATSLGTAASGLKHALGH